MLSKVSPHRAHHRRHIRLRFVVVATCIRGIRRTQSILSADVTSNIRHTASNIHPIAIPHYILTACQRLAVAVGNTRLVVDPALCGYRHTAGVHAPYWRTANTGVLCGAFVFTVGNHTGSLGPPARQVLQQSLPLPARRKSMPTLAVSTSSLQSRLKPWDL